MILPLFFGLGLLAGTTNLPDRPAAPAMPPALHEVAPGVFELNGVRLSKKDRRVSFPAIVNQREGLIEYLLVNEKGKTHESLLATKLIPHDIHLALLLIGLKPDKNANLNEPVPPDAIDPSYLQAAPKLKGASVQISVAWTENGKRREVPAAEWIFNLKTKQPMTPGPWTYNGSLVENGTFLADQDLSIASVVTDPTALVNNPREGYDDDEIWQVREKVVPPLNTPVEISITLAESTPPGP